jgi:uncharacterized protein
MRRILTLTALVSISFTLVGQGINAKFNVISFYTARQDAAHISFVREAHTWFSRMAARHHFRYDSTRNWNNLNDEFLSRYQVVIFLDTRPDSLPQRKAFQRFMERGGAWIGFHFAAFALTPSAYPQNWDWYHQHFLGGGEYASNTWRPTSAILRVENKNHPVTKRLPSRFNSSPNEWYRWKNDLRKNTDIQILLSVDSASFPLGTGPKPHEIWHTGYYPVAWTNLRYRMVYFNMGHNDIDYENGTGKELSFTFNNKIQDRLVIDALLWLAKSNQNK